jgi:hypothetical protein
MRVRGLRFSPCLCVSVVNWGRLLLIGSDHCLPTFTSHAHDLPSSITTKTSGR